MSYFYENGSMAHPIELTLTPQTLLAQLSVTPRGHLVPYTASVYLVSHELHSDTVTLPGAVPKVFEFELVPPQRRLVAVDGLEFVLCLSVHESVDGHRLMEALHRAWWRHAYGEKALETLTAELKDPQHPRLLMAQMAAEGVAVVEQQLRFTSKSLDRLATVREELSGYDALFVVKRVHLLQVNTQCRQYDRLRRQRLVTWKLVLDNHLAVQFLVDRLRAQLWVDGQPTAVRVWRLLDHDCLEPLDERRPDAQLYVTQQTLKVENNVVWQFANSVAMQQCYVHSACAQHAGGELSEEAMWREGLRVPKRVALNVFDFWSNELTLPLLRVDYARRIARLTQDTRAVKQAKKKTAEKDVKVRGESARPPMPELGRKRMAQTTLAFAPKSQKTQKVNDTKSANLNDTS